MNKISTASLAVIAASLLAITASLICARPLKTGVLNGHIIFRDNQQSQAGVGSKIEFYENFAVVSIFDPNAKNQAKEVYPLDQIRLIPLQ